MLHYRRTGGNRVQDKTENEQFIVLMCSRSPFEFGHSRCRAFVFEVTVHDTTRQDQTGGAQMYAY